MKIHARFLQSFRHFRLIIPNLSIHRALFLRIVPPSLRLCIYHSIYNSNMTLHFFIAVSFWRKGFFGQFFDLYPISSIRAFLLGIDPLSCFSLKNLFLLRLYIYHSISDITLTCFYISIVIPFE